MERNHQPEIIYPEDFSSDHSSDEIKLFEEGFPVNSITIDKFFVFNCDLKMLPTLLQRLPENLKFSSDFKKYFENSKE